MRHRDQEEASFSDDLLAEGEVTSIETEVDEPRALGKFAFAQTCLHGFPSVTGFCEH